MNEERIKSAIELALEKTARIGQQAKAQQEALTEEMKKEIAEIENEYASKMAEKDIMLQSELKKLYRSFHPTEATERANVLQEKLRLEKRALEEEKKAKIEGIRKRAHRDST